MKHMLTSVTLCITSDLTSPDYWTQYFGVEADYVHRKGVPIITPSGRVGSGNGRINSWVSSSEKHIKSEDLDEHLNYFVERLKLPRTDMPNVLANKLSDLLCFYSWNNFSGAPCPYMSKGLLEIFGSSGIAIEDGMMDSQEV